MCSSENNIAGEKMLKQPRPTLKRPLTHLDIDHVLCFSCGACVAVCPPDALFLQDLVLTVDHSRCTRCDRCVAMCPVQALALLPEPISEEEALHEAQL
jgi:ferredoxin